jgi:hypothetical protein
MDTAVLDAAAETALTSEATGRFPASGQMNNVA